MESTKGPRLIGGGATILPFTLLKPCLNVELRWQWNSVLKNEGEDMEQAIQFRILKPHY